MSTVGDYGDEMGHLHKLSDSDTEALLAGRVPTGDGDLGSVAEFIATAKTLSVQAPDAGTEQRHLAAIVDAAHLTSRAPVVGVQRSKGRKKMLSTLLAPLWAKIAVASASAVLATGGLAAADVLPEPAQNAVASVAENIGIELPSAGDRSDEGETDGDVSGQVEGENGDDADSKRVDDDVRTVLEDESLEGRDKGAAVSDAADANRQDEGKPTGASGVAEDAREYGPDNHPTGNPTDEGAADDAQSRNPTGYGADNHPTGPAR